MAEHKYNDIAVNNDAGLGSASPLLITPTFMATGTGVGSRVGKAISAVSLHFRGFIWQPNTATVPTFVRFIVFRSVGEDFGSPPAIADILNHVGTGNDLVNSPQSPESKGAYHILRDRVLELDYRDTQARYFNFKVKLGGGKVEYLTNGAAQVDASTGHYYIFVLTSLAGGSTSSANLNYVCRLYYTDA